MTTATDPTLSDAVDVVVDLTAPAGVPSTPDFERWARAALRGTRAPRQAELCIRLVDAEESRRLNAAYRGIDKPTNVLSFPGSLELPDGRNILGDLAVCAEVVVREARQQGKAADDHFAHMVVHGVLHLLGYDHEVDAQAAVMEGLEREVLQGLGIADPYAER